MKGTDLIHAKRCLFSLTAVSAFLLAGSAGALEVRLSHVEATDVSAYQSLLMEDR